MFKSVSKKESISLDNICHLICKSKTDKDNLGNNIFEETEILCFCSEKPAMSSEFFNANQQGIKSSIVLLIDSESYKHEESVKYNDEIYSIYRTYSRQDGFTELYLTKRIGENG